MCPRKRGGTNMSGKYQHDIPRSLQRGFAVERKPGKFQVTVYDRDQGIFSTSPEGVAGESYSRKCRVPRLRAISSPGRKGGR